MSLANSDSSGRDEVLLTIARDSTHNGEMFARLCRGAAFDWGFHGDTVAAQKTTVAGIVNTLAGLGTPLVQGKDITGASVSITSGTPADSTRISLTSAGRVEARHPRQLGKRAKGHNF